jgi:predicted metal-binding membrane protein
MGGMEMLGGWTMSHMWMLMPGQSWLGATASFVGMWTVMMVAMMLPSLMPALLRHRESLGYRISDARAGWLAVTVGVAYFAVWVTIGVVVFPLGVALADLAMSEPRVAHVVPTVLGAVVVGAGLLQHSAWKARQLDRCRAASGAMDMHVDTRIAWRHGWCLGVHCVRSCAGLTAVALCLGVMDLRVMVAVAIAVTAERLASDGVRAARLVGVVVIGIGLSALAGWHVFG